MQHGLIFNKLFQYGRYDIPRLRNADNIHILVVLMIIVFWR